MYPNPSFTPIPDFCDIYSLEIIMQLRTPFQGEPLRPMLSKQLCDETINLLLRACWSENPDHRPPFGSIRRQLRDTSPDRSDLQRLFRAQWNAPQFSENKLFSLSLIWSLSLKKKANKKATDYKIVNTWKIVYQMSFKSVSQLITKPDGKHCILNGGDDDSL